MLFLTFFGWLSEKRLAPKWLIGTAGVAIVISACASVFLVPDEKWPQEINPVGFSQVAYMLVVTGIFSAHTISATKILQKARKINLPVIEWSIKTVVCRMEQTTTMVGFLLASATFYWIISTELTDSADNLTGAIGHSVGTIIGIIFVMAAVSAELIEQKRS